MQGRIQPWSLGRATWKEMGVWGRSPQENFTRPRPSDSRKTWETPFLLQQTGGNLVLSQSATLFTSEAANHIASLNNRNNRGLDVTDDHEDCKQTSSQLLAPEPPTLKST